MNNIYKTIGILAHITTFIIAIIFIISLFTNYIILESQHTFALVTISLLLGHLGQELYPLSFYGKPKKSILMPRNWEEVMRTFGVDEEAIEKEKNHLKYNKSDSKSQTYKKYKDSLK